MNSGPFGAKSTLQTTRPLTLSIRASQIWARGQKYCQVIPELSTSRCDFFSRICKYISSVKKCQLGFLSICCPVSHLSHVQGQAGWGGEISNENCSIYELSRFSTLSLLLSHTLLRRRALSPARKRSHTLSYAFARTRTLTHTHYRAIPHSHETGVSPCGLFSKFSRQI